MAETLFGTTGKRALLPVVFELVDEGRCPVLGLASCIKLNIVHRCDSVTTEEIISEYKECFTGIGRFEREHEIRIDPSVTPVINRARRIPLAMTDKVKTELEKMEKLGIIATVDEPTKWVSSMVVAEKKDGSVRICLDPRELNNAILREHHHIPTLDDIAHKFAGTKLFTILDMKHAYWHIPLDRKSQLLTTFNTPFGRECFLRLPFGINSSAEVFEKRVEDIVSADGLRPDPEKVQAINEMPNPTDSKGIQRLMGSLNFLRGFIPNVSEITEPLRALLNVDEYNWVWEAEQDKAMAKIKQALTNEPLLQYFDVHKETTL